VLRTTKAGSGKAGSTPDSGLLYVTKPMPRWPCLEGSLGM
jgi:hypothetical protein